MTEYGGGTLTNQIVSNNNVSMAGNAAGVATAVINLLASAAGLATQIMTNLESQKERRLTDNIESIKYCVCAFAFFHKF